MGVPVKMEFTQLESTRNNEGEESDFNPPCSGEEDDRAKRREQIYRIGEAESDEKSSDCRNVVAENSPGIVPTESMVAGAHV